MIFFKYSWLLWLLGGFFLGPSKAEKSMELAVSGTDSFEEPSGGKNLARSRLYDNMRFFDKKGKAFTLRSLSKNNRNMTLLIFWAPWCSPCLKEMPSVNQLYQMIGSVVNVVAVSIEPPGEGRTGFSVEDFSWNKEFFGSLLENPESLPLFHSPEANHFMGLEKIDSIPTALLYDEKGYLLLVIKGAKDWSLKENRQMLGEVFGISGSIKRAERLWSQKNKEIKRERR